MWLLFLAGCARPQPPVFKSSAYECLHSYSDEQARLCVQQAAGRVAKKSVSQAFDALVEHERTATRRNGGPAADWTPELEAQVLAFGAGAFRVAIALAEQGKTDLAIRRGRYVCSAWSERGLACPFAEELDALESAARKAHLSVAQAERERWPLAALFHECLADSKAPSCSRVSELANAMRPGVLLEVRASAECLAALPAGATEALEQRVAPKGGPTLGRFELELSRCELRELSNQRASQTCYFQRQSQRMDGSFHKRETDDATEPVEVKGTRVSFSIAGSLRVIESNVVAEAAKLPTGTMKPVSSGHELWADRATRSQRCSFGPRQLLASEAKLQARDTAWSWLGQGLIHEIALDGVVGTTALFGAARRRGDAAEAEHWAVLTVAMGASAEGAGPWLWDRYGLDAGVERPREGWPGKPDAAARWVGSGPGREELGMVENGFGRTGFPFSPRAGGWPAFTN